MFTSDGTAKQNMQPLSLPYHSGGSDNKKRKATYYLHHLFMLWHQHMIWLFLDVWLFKGDISIFHASSFHILLQTSFGLQIQIQHVPVMQVYVSLEQSYKAKTRGKLAKSHGRNTVHTVQLEILVAVCNTYSLMYVDVLVYYETILAVHSCHKWNKPNHICEKDIKASLKSIICDNTVLYTHTLWSSSTE